MKIAIFTEGTIIMHQGAVGHSREEIVQQVIHKDPSVKDYATYVPIRNAPQKIKAWADQGAEIIYITSRRNKKEVEEIKNVLTQNQFPNGLLEYRKEGEEYKDVAERILPDVLIEDDCESIGGEQEMIYPHIRPELKEKMHLITIKEFSGIDNLPDRVESLYETNRVS